MSQPASHEVALRLEGVRVRYAQRMGMFRSSAFWPLQGIDLTVMAGETLGVIGRNGVGKSTLLKVMAGIIAPDRGTVETFGRKVSLLGLMLGMNANLSGRDNAIMNAMLQGVEKKAIESKLDEIERFAELQGFFDQPVRVYSAGMRARLSFAVAMQVNPDILLIDEVLGVGDESFRRKSNCMIEELIRSEKTVVLVYHHLDTLRRLCHRIAWLDKGKIRMVGPCAEVIHRYRSES